MGITKISNWNNINAIVNKTLVFLGKPYPRQVNTFLDWYLKLDKKSYDIQDPVLKRWILEGIPQMKIIINLMNKEISKVEALLDKLLTSHLSLDQKIQKTKPYYEGLKDITETIIEFIGCRNKFGQWYLNLLKEYMTTSPVAKREYPFFEDTCLVNRQRLLTTKV